MCGIAGIVGREGSDSGAIVGSMLSAITHRGPDEQNVYVAGEAALAHARLSIIDLATGQQPMQSDDGSLTITYNGEIFNYIELRSELCRMGHRFRTESDTEVLLQLYQRYGHEALHRLNGEWAFAIWDRHRKTLFLSRDRMGVRPLYYTFAHGQFLFASEIKALFAHPGVSRSFDPISLDQIFTYWHPVSPRTAFSNIFEIPPGCSATLDQGRLDVRPYWDLNFTVCSGSDEQSSAERLLDLLDDATRIRLRADVPVGAYLSGGLDSSVTAALASKHVPRLKTFSLRFDQPDYDEGSFQELMAHRLGTDHEEFRCSSQAIGDIFPEVVRHAEQPILRTAPAPLYLLAKTVRRSGLKVVLTGEGSDEVLGGYDIFKELKIRRFVNAHPDSRWRPLLLKRLYPYLPPIGSQPTAFLRGFFQAGDDDVSSPYFSHLPRWRSAAGLRRFWSRDIREELEAGTFEPFLPSHHEKWGDFERAQYLEARHLLPGYILSAQGDRMAMAHAIEGRFPFLDNRVVEFAATLPATQKMKVLNEKYLLKRAVRGLIPSGILKRPKQPYRAPDFQSFFAGGKAVDYVLELLSPEQIARHGIFDVRGVQHLLAKARSGALPGVRDNMALTGIVSTALLAHTFKAGLSGRN